MKMSMRVAMVLTAASIAMSATPSRAWATTGPVESSVETGMKKVPEHAAQVARAVETELSKQLDGVDVTGASSIAVSVDFVPGESIGWYAYEVTATHAGKALTPIRERCDACKRKELVAKIGESIEKQRAAIIEADRASAPSDTAPAERASPTDPPPVGRDEGTTPSTEHRTRLRPSGQVGVAVLSAGAAGVIAGAVLLGRPDDRTTLADDPQRFERKSTKPAGIGVLVVGGAAVVAGAVMVALAVKARRKNVVWAPMLGPKSVSISVGGKF